MGMGHDTKKYSIIICTDGHPLCTTIQEVFLDPRLRGDDRSSVDNKGCQRRVSLAYFPWSGNGLDFGKSRRWSFDALCRHCEGVNPKQSQEIATVATLSRDDKKTS